jgi:hypothetical protein
VGRFDVRIVLECVEAKLLSTALRMVELATLVLPDGAGWDRLRARRTHGVSGPAFHRDTPSDASLAGTPPLPNYFKRIKEDAMVE